MAQSKQQSTKSGTAGSLQTLYECKEIPNVEWFCLMQKVTVVFSNTTPNLYYKCFRRVPNKLATSVGNRIAMRQTTIISNQVNKSRRSNKTIHALTFSDYLKIRNFCANNIITLLVVSDDHQWWRSVVGNRNMHSGRQ